MRTSEIPKGRDFTKVSEKERQRILAERKAIYDKAEFLGINIMVFDNDGKLAEEIEKQYERDSSIALECILGNKEVPKDVQERLLRIKAMREQEKFKGNETT